MKRVADSIGRRPPPNSINRRRQKHRRGQLSADLNALLIKCGVHHPSRVTNPKSMDRPQLTHRTVSKRKKSRLNLPFNESGRRGDVSHGRSFACDRRLTSWTATGHLSADDGCLIALTPDPTDEPRVSTSTWRRPIVCPWPRLIR